MIIGQIAKQEAPYWSADCEVVGAFTQGISRKDAAAMLAEVIELMVNRKGFKVTVKETDQVAPNVYNVIVEANEPGLLAAEVLKYQREKHKLSLSDVAKRLGSSNHNAYAAYEQGRREPSLSKYGELLAAVAPEMALVVRPRGRGVVAPKRKPAGKKRAS